MLIREFFFIVVIQDDIALVWDEYKFGKSWGQGEKEKEGWRG